MRKNDSVVGAPQVFREIIIYRHNPGLMQACLIMVSSFHTLSLLKQEGSGKRECCDLPWLSCGSGSM